MARTVYLVIGHLTPTDADPDPDVQGKLDEDVAAVTCASREEAGVALLWYQDGIIREISV